MTSFEQMDSVGMVPIKEALMYPIVENFTMGELRLVDPTDSKAAEGRLIVAVLQVSTQEDPEARMEVTYGLQPIVLTQMLAMLSQCVTDTVEDGQALFDTAFAVFEHYGNTKLCDGTCDSKEECTCGLPTEDG